MKTLNANIHEAGNGFPTNGDYVQADGEPYRIVSMAGHIQTGAPGVGNWISASIEPARWEDFDAGAEFPCTVKIKE